MVFSDTARSQLFFTEEVTWGVTPAVALDTVRFTGESLNFAIDNVQSNEIRSDRQITDLIQTDAEPSGDVNFELSYAAFDNLLEGAFFSDFVAPVSMAGVTFAAVSGSPDSFTDSGNGFVAAGILPGQWLKVGGFATGANNGYVQVLIREKFIGFFVGLHANFHRAFIANKNHCWKHIAKQLAVNTKLYLDFFLIFLA